MTEPGRAAPTASDDEPGRPASERFPSTQLTLIGSLLEQGSEGRREAGRLVMDLYDQPLQAYFSGSSFRTLGAPEEVVDSFFANRLERDGFLGDWLESGARFRYWLIRAFHNYLLERRRSDRRWQRGASVGREAYRDGQPPDAEAIFHREAALSIVRASCRRVELECRDLGLDDHWKSFVRHHLDGLDYRTVGDELKVTPARASVMARTAAGRFRAALRSAVGWHGATEREVDDELHSLMEVLHG